MSLNPDLIRARCAEIDSSLSRLEEFRRLPREQFLSNKDALGYRISSPPNLRVAWVVPHCAH
jgi:hypothetical protein